MVDCTVYDIHAHAYYVLVYGIVLLLEEVKLDLYWTNSAVDIDMIIMLTQYIMRGHVVL